MGLDTKTYWLTNRQSQRDFDFDLWESWDGNEKSRRLVWDGRQPEWVVRQSLTSKGVITEAEEATTLEAVTRRQPA
jgi:hypothetical protein